MDFLIKIARILLIVYIVILSFLYAYQERLLFHPGKLSADYNFDFRLPFVEIKLDVGDVNLNGLKFNVKNPKGAIVFFHGNAGSLRYWGGLSEFFTTLGYDFYVFDYRGFGKSGGQISNEKQLFSDIDKMIEYVLSEHKPENTVLVGYSLGSGLAARAAQKYSVRDLVLIAPYFRLDELASSKVKFVPKFIVKYKIPTAEFIKKATNTRITIFHGTHDSLIPISNSQRLSQLLRENDVFYELQARHNDLIGNLTFQKIMSERF